jgi:hypothetical protein
LGEFVARWKKIDPRGGPIPWRVDYRLIDSALARWNGELDINPRWKRDPHFCIEQTLTPVIQSARLPRFRLEERQRPNRVTPVGILG